MSLFARIPTNAYGGMCHGLSLKPLPLKLLRLDIQMQYTSSSTAIILIRVITGRTARSAATPVMHLLIIIIIITDLYSAFRSEDTEALDAAQED